MAALSCIHPPALSAALALPSLGVALATVTPAQAATLAYQSESITTSETSATWISPFTGPVTVSFELENPNDSPDADLDIDVNVLINGEVKHTQEILGATGKSRFDFNLESVGYEDKVSFDANFINGSTAFKTSVLVNEPSLIFIEPTGDSIGQVALFYNDIIYESYQAYTDSPYQNVLPGNSTATVPAKAGVQKTHTLGTFLGLVDESTDRLLPWGKAELEPIDPEVAALMAAWIDPDEFYDPDNPQHRQLFLNSFAADYPTFSAQQRENLLDLLNVRVDPGRFADPNNPQHQAILSFPTNPFARLDRSYIPTFVQDFTTPVKQKGLDGGRYSGVGLIERAAELAGVNAGQGYILNELEFIPVDQIILSQSGFGCTVVGCSQPITRTQFLSALSPSRLYQGINGQLDLDEWLQGWLEEVDFVLTGPEGNRLTFLNGQVLENTLGADVSIGSYGADSGLGNSGGQSCENPPKSGDPELPKENLQFVQFLLRERKPGSYRIQLTGRSALSRAVVGNEKTGLVVGVGDCFEDEDILIPEEPPVRPEPEEVPEPTLVLGLLTAGGVGLLSQRRRSQL